MSGLIQVDTERCKGCSICVSVCPEGVMELSDSINNQGYPTAVAANEGCTGCRFCALMCPDVAIKVMLA